jgi:TetR/AcrR family transcriptional regulator
MSSERVDRVLTAAYRCFVRHGVRKTTMDDVAVEAGMSRPAVYQYVRNKQDAFGRVLDRIYGEALAHAGAAAIADGTLAQRMDRILTVKLSVAQRLSRDGLHPDGVADRRIWAESEERFTTAILDLLTDAVRDAASQADLTLSGGNAREMAELALALARGLEIDATDSQRPRERLRNGIALLVAGLAAATQAR